VDLDEQLVFTGDHVLPRISPNIGISAQMMGRDALGEYLESLTAMRVWDDFEVCPGHEYRFRGLAARCDQLRDHHAARCREISEVIQSTGSTSAWRTAEQLTWSRGWSSLEGGNRRGALAETLAHIEYLRRRGIIPKSTS
jgi:glyoxylase-like metal-dependent hydrolase (beta-lactamase superfamily II)